MRVFWVGLCIGLLSCQAWLDKHDPLVHQTSKDCSGVDEEKCGASCCDGYLRQQCNVWANPPRCEATGNGGVTDPDSVPTCDTLGHCSEFKRTADGGK